MKKHIMQIIVALALCASSASFAACGNRADDSSESSATTSATSNSSADSASNSDSGADSNSGTDAGNNTDTDSTSDSQTDDAPSVESSGTAMVAWTSSADIEGNADVCTITFKVKDGAANGLSVVTADPSLIIADQAFQEIDVEVVAGGVNIGGDASESTASGAAILFDTVSANAGDTVELPVRFANFDYCSTFEFMLCYDSEVLEIVDIEGSDPIDENGLLLYNVL